MLGKPTTDPHPYNYSFIICGAKSINLLLSHGGGIYVTQVGLEQGILLPQ